MKRSPRRAARNQRRRLRLETLENRTMLTTFTVNDLGTIGDSYLFDNQCDTRFNPNADPPIPASGKCTLAAAIQQANFNADEDTIQFNIDTDEVPVFVGGINGSKVNIDGRSQPGAGMVSIQGLRLRNGADNIFVRGVIAREGIEVVGDNNEIYGNYVGLTTDGSAIAETVNDAIEVNGNNNVIGGDTIADGNVVAGATDHAIRVNGNNVSVKNNYVGLNADGDTLLTSSELDGFSVVWGIVVNGENIVIQDNVVAGSQNVGIRYAGTAGEVTGNLVGTNAAGTEPFGGGDVGIATSPGSTDILIADNVVAAHDIGVGLSFSNEVVVRGNKVGTDITGNVIDLDDVENNGNEFGNRDFGIDITGNELFGRGINNIIGGPNAADANVVSGNDVGIGITNGPGNNIIEGNYVGTNADGTAALPNETGIQVSFSKYNQIGGANPNVVSGNATYGIVIQGSNAIQNIVVNNTVGLTEDGIAPLPNETGVLINDAQQNCIGGVVPTDIESKAHCFLLPTADNPLVGNVISANEQFGIQLANPNAKNNVIQSNYIGTDFTGTVTDPDGTADSGDEYGNGFDGVGLFAGASSNLIGGTRTGTGNVISGNLGDGIFMMGAENSITANNVVSGNYIGVDKTGAVALGNGARGIHLSQHSESTMIGGARGNERNIISGNGLDGIRIITATSKEHVVANNFIGLNKDGDEALPNGMSGISIQAAKDNLIGKLIDQTSFSGNLISGNTEHGIKLQAGAMDNIIQGNDIGTDFDGTKRIPNKLDGVYIVNSADNQIGSDFDTNPNVETFTGNLISGNTGNGVHIHGENATGNLVGGNLIGTDRTGKNPLANFGHGVLIDDASDNRIGQSVGTEAPLSGNTIAANTDGIRIQGQGSQFNAVGQNKIGVDYTGKPHVDGLLGQAAHGIHIRDASENIIGGIFPAGGGGTVIDTNIIADNSTAVQIVDETSINNQVRFNSIFDNGRYGIDLGNTRGTPNDDDDSDTGPNQLQNFPTLDGFTLGKVQGQLQSTPNEDFVIDLYGSFIEEPTRPQGKEWLGQTVVSTSDLGLGFFEIPVGDGEGAPSVFTATATDGNGNTSEISAALALPDLHVPPVLLSPDDVIRQGSKFVIPYEVTIQNLGAGRAEDVVVRIEGNGDLLSALPHRITLPGKEGDETPEIQIAGEWDITPILNQGSRGEGVFDFEVRVNPNRLVSEIDLGGENHMIAPPFSIDARPAITQVRTDFIENGFFLAGVELENRVHVFVDWNGELDDSLIRPSDQPQVDVQVNGNPLPPLNATQLSSDTPTQFVFDMGSDLSLGGNEVSIEATTKEHLYVSDETIINYDQGNSVAWIGTLLWTVEPIGPEWGRIAEYSVGIAFPPATEGFFGVPVDRVGLAGDAFGSKIPQFTLRAKLRSDRSNTIEGEVGLEGKVGGKGWGTVGGQLKLIARGNFRFIASGIELDSLQGIIDGQISLQTPSVPFPPPATFIRASAKAGFGARATFTVDVTPENTLDFQPFQLIAGPSLEAIASVGAAVASAEVGIGGRITGTFEIPSECILDAVGIELFARLKATFLMFEAEKTFSFPFSANTCGGASGEGEHLGARIVQSSYGLTPRIDPEDRAEGAPSSAGLPDLSYIYAKPSLAVHDDGTMTLVYLDDDPNKPNGQHLEVFATMYDGSEWSAPQQLTDDQYLDDLPQVAYDNQGRPVAVWSSVRNVISDPATVDPTTLPEFMEIAYSFYDSTTDQWSAPTLITDNSTMDALPTLNHAANGDLVLGWKNDADNSYPLFADGTESLTSQWQTRSWNGSEWSTATTDFALSSPEGAQIHQFDDGTAVAVWSADQDDSGLTINDTDIAIQTFDGANWSAPHLYESGNGSGDLEPQLFLQGDNLMISWVQTGVHLGGGPNDLTDILTVGTIVNGTITSPMEVASSESIRESTVLVDGDRLLATWQGKSAAGTDIFYSALEASATAWSAAATMTNNAAYEWWLNPFVNQSGELEVFYLERDVDYVPAVPPVDGQGEGEGEDVIMVPELGASALISATTAIAPDLTVTSLELDNPRRGQTSDVTVQVTNNGPVSSTATQLQFTDGETTQVLDVPALSSGESVDLSLDWLPPSGSTIVTLVAEVDPDNQVGEQVEDNNQLERVTLAGDLSPSNIRSSRSGDTIDVVATISNSGQSTIDGPFVVQLRRDDPVNGPVLSETTVSQSLQPGTSMEVSLSFSDLDSNLPVTATGFIVVDPSQEVVDRDRDNNDEFFFLNPYETWTNPADGLDVNADGQISPLDALLLINRINDGLGGALPNFATPPLFLDPNSDNQLSPIDILLIINFLNSSREGEGEALDSIPLRASYHNDAGVTAASESSSPGPTSVQSIDQFWLNLGLAGFGSDEDEVDFEARR